MAFYKMVQEAESIGQFIQHTAWYTTIMDATFADLQDLVDGYDADFKTAFRPSLADDFNVIQYNVREVTPVGLPGQVIIPTAGPWAGTNATDPTALQNALVLSLKSVTAPPNQGRNYIGGWTEAAMTNGLWTAATVALGNAFGPLTFQYVALSGLQFDRIIATYDPVTKQVVAQNLVSSAIARERVGTQRSRTRAG